MQFETYRGRTMMEALAKVKETCGDDAIIKTTRQEGAPRGAFATPLVEVVAAPAAYQRHSTIRVKDRHHRVAPVNEMTDDKLAHLEAEIKRLTERVQQLSKRKRPQRRAENMLLEGGIDAPLAKELADQLPKGKRLSAQQMRDELRGELGRRLIKKADLLSADGPRLIACVGPTGAGKTTTLAKLASLGRLEQDKSVGVLSLDTYRVGANAQWDRYSQLLKIPFRVAFTQEEAEEALNEMRDCDHIFIDTPGNLPNTGDLCQRARDILGSMVDRGLETLLVLPAALQAREALRMDEQFSRPQPTGLVLTKVDEIDRVGGVVQTSITQGLPFAYVCDGPSVPNDIHPFEVNEMVQRVLPDASIG